MTTPSGTITAGDVNTELGRSATASMSLNEEKVRRLANQTSGTVTFDDLRNKSRTKTYDSGVASPSRARSDSFYASNFFQSDGSWWAPHLSSYYVQSSAGALDVDLYDTSAYANASIQTDNLVLDVSVSYNIYDIYDASFGFIMGIKPVGYPFASINDYSNQNYLKSIFDMDSYVNNSPYTNWRTATLRQSYSLSQAVSFGSVGGWSRDTTGQWNLSKIQNTSLFLSIGMNYTQYNSFAYNAGQPGPVRINSARITGSYQI